MADLFDLSPNTSAIDQDIQRLRHLDPANFNANMMQLAAKLGVKLEEIGLDYPPQPPPRKPKPRYSKKTGKRLKDRKPKRYKRTGRLGSNLTSEPRHTSLNTWAALFGTDVEYSPYVIALPSDNPGQAYFHQGTWTPLRQQIEANLPALRQYVWDEVRRMIDAFIK